MMDDDSDSDFEQMSSAKVVKKDEVFDEEGSLYYRKYISLLVSTDILYTRNPFNKNLHCLFISLFCYMLPPCFLVISGLIYVGCTC